MQKPHRAALIVLSALLLASGCNGQSGGKTHKVSGSVTYDGQPVPNVSVVFNPTAGEGARPGTAITDAEGKFESVTTFQSGDGVIPGAHTVTLAKITNSEEVIDSPDAYSAAPAGDLPFPSKYLNTAESDLKVEITENGQTVNLELSQ